jgi:hypothetical protein
MIVSYIRWHDAVSEEASDSRAAKACLAELCEVGFLLDETDQAVTIGMEYQQQEAVQPGRWRLHIPKVCIIERRDVDLDKAFTRGRKRK